MLLRLKVWCQASYEGEIEVPDGLTEDEAVMFAQNHLADVKLGELQYLPDSDEIDPEDANPYFVYDKGE